MSDSLCGARVLITISCFQLNKATVAEWLNHLAHTSYLSCSDLDAIRYRMTLNESLMAVCLRSSVQVYTD